MKINSKILLGGCAVALAGLALWLLWPAAPDVPRAQARKPALPATTSAPVAQAADTTVSRPAAPTGTPPPSPATAPAPVSLVLAKTSTPSATQPSSAPATAPTPVPDQPPASIDEPAATARMYAAHASLRTPEVADPDSATNRQILQTMVMKALSSPATPPPVATLSTKP